MKEDRLMRHSLLKYKSINLNNIDTIDDDNDDDHDMNLNSHDDFANDDIESSASDHSILTSDKLTSATTNRDYDRRIKTTNNKYINKKKVISNNNNKNKNKNNLNWLSSLCLQYDDYSNCINLYLFLYLLLLIIIIILMIIIYTSNQYDYHQLYHDLFIYQQHSSLSNYSSSSSNHCGDNRTDTGINNYHIISGDKNDSFYILVGKQQHLQQQQVSSSRSLYCYLSSSLLTQEGTGVSIPILMIEQLTTGLGKYNNSITYMTSSSSSRS